MSLAYLTSIFPKLTATFIYREVIELQRRGKHIKIYSLHKPDHSELSEESIPLCEETYYLLPVKTSRLFKSHIKFLVRNPLKYGITLLRMMTGTYDKFQDRLRGLMHFGEGVVLADKMLYDGITHIHAHYASHPTSVARVIFLLANIPYSFTAHAHDIWNDRLMLPEKIQEATFAICCTKIGQKRLIEQAKQDVSKKIHLVYHGLDVRKFNLPQNGEERENNLILSIGSLGVTKGFPDLIKACAILKGRNINIRCLIIGEGDLRPKLEALIHSYNLAGQVNLIGALPQEKIIEFYRKARVFVLPCITTINGNHDGLPNVLMEAMATGLPVITTANTGQIELINNRVHGLLVAQNSPMEIANAIESLIKDNNLWKKIQYNARQRMVNDFDNRNTIKPLLNLLDKYGEEEICMSGMQVSRHSD